MAGKGSTQLKEYREKGKKLTQRGAINAKCADCMGDYADGRDDCDMQKCPLYPWQPYGKVWKSRVSRKPEIIAENEAASILASKDDILEDGEE
jgi:hypothetical protein